MTEQRAAEQVDVTPFEVATTDIDGLLVITMKQIADSRGVIRELYRESALTEAVGALGPWKQINATETSQGVIRGLHAEAMTKLVAIVSGRAFGAYVDAREDSPTAGRLVTVELVPGVQVLVPKGVCNGFQSLDEGVSQYLYCFDEEWVPGMPGKSVNPLDPALAIPWPIPVEADDLERISRKDAAAPTLAEALATPSS